ncbi:MAG: thiamine-phosphate kinase [Alphaproteobacteria bacterium]|nr:thiamine-phosphate kinase [Alphaproteobacteria bacterium]
MKGSQKRAARAREFDLIERHFAPLSRAQPGAFDLLDDAAVLQVPPGADLVVTNDTVVAGVHFIGDEPADLVARKLLGMNLSDLAAMGSRPIAYSLSFAIPSDTPEPWIASFAAGLAHVQSECGVTLIGGDSVSTPGPATLGITAYGTVPTGRALLRSGAEAGEHVFVSGTLGDGALGLMAARGALPGLTDAARAFLIDRYRVPRPRLELGLKLIGIASAAVDVSDGLVADLGHIALASGVSVTVESPSVPLSEAAREALSINPELIEQVLTGGDDYELAFTAPVDAAPALTELSAALGLPISRIGRVGEGAGVKVLDASGEEIRFTSTGFGHF